MNEARVARVTEVIAGSPNGFDDAIKRAFDRATKTMRVIELRVNCENDEIKEYRVRMEVIFILE